MAITVIQKETCHYLSHIQSCPISTGMGWGELPVTAIFHPARGKHWDIKIKPSFETFLLPIGHQIRLRSAVKVEKSHFLKVINI